MPRMPGSSDDQAAAETIAQSSPAIVVPGVGISTGSPACSAAVRQAAVSGSTPITVTPGRRPVARRGRAPSEPTPIGTRITSHGASSSSNSVA